MTPPVAYLYDSETKKFTGETTCQRDPLESEAAGHDIFLMPGSATAVEPPAEKDGFDRVWNPEDKAWDYQEKPVEPESKPYEPTELELAQQNMWAAKQKLAETDYVNDKINDATNTGKLDLAEQLKEKYAPVFAEREGYREDVRHWESEIERLTAEQTDEDDE